MATKLTVDSTPNAASAPRIIPKGNQINGAAADIVPAAETDEEADADDEVSVDMPFCVGSWPDN